VKSSASISVAVAVSASTRSIATSSSTDWDDVARGYGLEVDLVVGCHHAKGLLDAQMKGAAHALGDMPADGA
jgi:hypothetical protein